MLLLLALFGHLYIISDVNVILESALGVISALFAACFSIID